MKKTGSMTRFRLDLDGTWDFFPDPSRELSIDLLAQHRPRPIRVPAPWQAQFEDMRHYTGVAWYRRTFRLPEEIAGLVESGKCLVLGFGAVDYFATVILNGALIGEHEGGYLPFEFRIYDEIKIRGDNELLVRVIDPGNDPDAFPEFTFSEIPHGKQSWYGPVSGIWQSVWLEARHDSHITLLHATPQVKAERAHLSVTLSQPVTRGKEIRFGVKAPSGRLHETACVLQPGQHQVECAVSLPNPELWDTQNPLLYEVDARLLEKGGTETLDDFKTTFGMREISTSPDGHLMLNGRVLFLRGALDQDYYPDDIYSSFSDEELDDQFAKAKHMGLNILRAHIKIADPRYYQAADRAGLLIWAELPNWQELTEGAKERAMRTLSGMVARDWNHPSIVIWTIINEGWGLDLAGNSDHRRWLSETYSFLKGLDPNRLVVGNSPCFSNFHVVTDIEDFHNYYAIPDHYRQWEEWVKTFSARPSWTFATSYEGIESWRQYTRDPWNPTPRTPAPEVRRSGREPMVVSEFGNWGLPDVAKLRECYGGKDPWWFESGLEWGNGVVYPHGIEERFKSYCLGKVFPTLSDLCAASQRMQFTALKYQIERIRLRPNLVGYIITEFTDVHWEANGLLDLCRNPKEYYDAIGMVNSSDAIVPEWERVAFWEGERCEVRLSFSHFSATHLVNCRVEWFVDAFPDIQGSFDLPVADSAKLLNVGTVAFTVPSLKTSKRARLEVRLLDQTGQLVTCNHQELYFFPRIVSTPRGRFFAADIGEARHALEALGWSPVPDTSGAEISIATSLTDEARSYIQGGGKLLWLPQTTESQQTYLGSLGLSARASGPWQGDWASSMSWIRQDKMFRSIPTGGTVDFAFADLTPELVVMGLRPFEFESDVHAGLFVGWIHQAVPLVAHRRIGQGQLLVCTFRLLPHLGRNPVATILMDDMLQYLKALKS